MDQPPRTAPVITKTPEPETLQSAYRSQQSPKDPLYARTRERLRELLLSPEAQKVWTAFAPQNVSPTKQVLSYRAISRAIAAHMGIFTSRVGTKIEFDAHFLARKLRQKPYIFLQRRLALTSAPRKSSWNYVELKK